jgi:microcystin-dependent protein
MSTPYLGEIRIFTFFFPPKGWATCDGQLMPIAQNTALFSLLGTMYGGNGQTTFALPNLRSRVPIHFGQGPGLSNYFQGQTGGEEAHTLTINEMPAHNHNVQCNTAGDNSASPTSPVGNYWTKDLNLNLPYAASGAQASLHVSAIGTGGGSQPHTNIQPYLTVEFCIALEGIFPSRN